MFGKDDKNEKDDEYFNSARLERTTSGSHLTVTFWPSLNNDEWDILVQISYPGWEIACLGDGIE